MKLKWYGIRLQLTQQYCAGVVAGFGLGVVTMACTIGRPDWMVLLIPGFVLITIGSSWQGRLTHRKEDQKEP
jgi:hypothetical protein